ncbi:cadherin 23 (otocadherin), isoform CRA_d [Mus musculus]|nr:cadherin 23 (otocadherin), isoform CRA_d [Mus musculus]
MRYSLVTCYAVLWLLMLVPGSWGQVNRLPFFTNHFFDTYLLISEDTPVGSSVTQLLARDMDNDPLVFGVSGEEASRFFAVEPDTGVVWLRQPLDRETKSEFTVEFSVSDHQGVITRKVNIQVGDVNDNAPTFHNQPYSVRIPEVFHTQGLAHPKRIVPTTAPKMEMEAMRQQSLRRKTLNGVEVMFKVCRDYRHFQRAAGDPGGAGG